MADAFKFVQAQNFSLAGAGVIAGATTITLKSFTGVDGALLTMTDFGAIGFFTLEPGNGTLEEQGCFTGVTQNANGTATLTGVSTVLFIAPYTQTSGLAKTHAGSTALVISNTAGFYDKMTSKSDDETITGIWTFTNPNYPKMDTATPAPVSDGEFATKKYVDDTAIAGAPKATDSVYGITKLSTAAVDPAIPIAVGDNDARVPTTGENNALVGNNTDIAVGTGNKFVTQTGLQESAEVYAASATGNDTYVVTLSPVPTSLVDGMTIRFKPDTANTGAATLNVNSLGALAIVTGLSTALATGDILANQVCTVVYNSTGTVWQLLNPIVKVPTFTRLDGYDAAADTTENTVYTTTITGGFLGANGGIFTKTPISFYPGAQGGTYTIRLKYGGTTLSTLVITKPAVGGGTAEYLRGTIEAFIINNSTTNSQHVGFYGLLGNSVGVVAGTQTGHYVSTQPADTTSAIDTTTNQTLTMTVQKNIAGIDGEDQFYQTIVEVKP